jgi:alpha-tubulin suppressor-like RCC1 family protein
LTVNAVNQSGEPLRYAWYEGADYIKQTNRTLSVSTTLGFPRGPLYAVVSDFSGSVTSAPAFVECYGVISWGDYRNQLRPAPTNLVGVSTVALGFHSIFALNEDSSIVGWGAEGTPPAGLAKTVSVSKRSNTALSLTADGLVQEWVGGNAATREGLSNIVAVSAGSGHCLALEADGTVHAWGNNFLGQATVPSGLRNAVRISAGSYHSMALQADGTVVVWGGQAGTGVTNVPPGLTGVVGIAAGYCECFAIHRDGTVTKWGQDPDGLKPPPAPALTNVLRMASSFHTLALTRDGELIGFGMDYSMESMVPYYVREVTDIAVDSFSSAAVMGKRPPFLTAPLPSRPVEAGRSAHFVMSATGSLPLSYQWRYNGAPIPGATDEVLSLWSAQPTDRGAYSVTVRNAYGEVTSADATLEVIGFSIVEQPTDQLGFLGQEVEFHIGVVAGIPVNYQWYFEGNPILSATNAILKLANLRADQAGKYWVTVQNGLMTERSVDATLALEALEVSVSPPTQRAVEGTIPFFQAQVRGLAPFTYQWQFNGSDLPGETRSMLSLENVQASQAGSYSVIVSNQYAVAASQAVPLTVESASYWLDTSADPSMPAAATNAVSIKEGVFHKTALLADGTVLSWGDGSGGQTNVPPGLAGVTQIDAGSYHSVALLTNGSVASWPIAAPAELTDAIAVAAGGDHNLALRKDGTVVGWGDGVTLISPIVRQQPRTLLRLLRDTAWMSP